MKTQTLSALAALAGVAAATNGWGSGNKFSCPSNTNNTCNPQQSTGFDWGSLQPGSFSNYGDFSFSGFDCKTGFGKRSGLQLNKRTGKCITGSASSNKGSSPSFSCGSSKSVKDFSVSHMDVDVEFDCDLEFHYEMPGGQTCKQTSPCKAGGSTVKNSQCGGATGVTVVYPSQPSKPKPTCSIAINTIGFDCGPPSSTSVHSSTKPATSSVTKPTTAVTTSNSKPETSPTKPASSSETKPASSNSKPETSPTKPASSSETKPAASSSETKPATSSESKPTTSFSKPESSKPETSPATKPTTAVYTNGTSAVTSPATSPSAVTSPATSPSPSVFTTSTIFTTQVSTIISCAPTVTNCPAQSTALTTLTIAVSTTICPVTETKPTTAPTVPVSSPATSGVVSTPPASSGVVSTPQVSSPVSSGVVSTPPAGSNVVTTVIVSQSTTICPVTKTHTTGGVTSIETGSTTSTIAVTITSTVCNKCEASVTTSAGPAPTAPAPTVLPQCLNTWNFIVGCIDNTDAACYCPSTDFVNNVYGCLSAYGADANEIHAAQSFFQGICAPYVPSNPAIITGASSVATTAGITAPASIPVTTIQVLTTLTVPCSQTAGPSAGSIIPSSSTTTVLSTAVTVPQVAFSTATPAPASGNAGATTAPAGPALVIGTPPAVPAGTTTAGATGGVAPPAKTTLASVPVSNGTAPTSTPVQVQVGSGASSNGVIVGSGLFAIVIAVLAL